MAAAVIAHFDAVASGQRDKGLNPPVARISAHLHQLFDGYSHGLIVLNKILFVKAGFAYAPFGRRLEKRVKGLAPQVPVPVTAVRWGKPGKWVIA